ncbi:MAG: hypothetical protein K2F79_09610, partial [Muribaculaceae bacterium]|nr:hypothetical protein [Muribaculaceae bacterium]
VWIGLYALECALPSGTNGYLSLPLIRNFYPVFMAGAIARRHSEAFGRLTASPNAVAAAIAVFAVTVSYVAWYWRYPFDTPLLRALVQPVMHLSIAVVAIAVVRPWSETAFGPSAPSGSHPLARMWEYIGSRSLAVYLLHYFFLFPMGGIRPLLEAVDFARVPLIVISALVAAIIVGVVLLTDHILSFAGPLYLLLTGSVKTKPENK